MEILEEAAEKEYPVFNRSTAFGSKFPWTPKREREAFIKGAKWQEKRMYSEEDIVLVISKYRNLKFIEFGKWFEEFKKQ
jgi:hypothetical protein